MDERIVLAELELQRQRERRWSATAAIKLGEGAMLAALVSVVIGPFLVADPLYRYVVLVVDAVAVGLAVLALRERGGWGVGRLYAALAIAIVVIVIALWIWAVSTAPPVGGT